MSDEVCSAFTGNGEFVCDNCGEEKFDRHEWFTGQDGGIKKVCYPECEDTDGE